MAKRSSKENARRRKQMARPWEPFVIADGVRKGQTERDKTHRKVEEKLKSSDECTYINNRYQVSKETVKQEKHGLGDFDLIWLSIKSLDDSARHDWREFQWIKNELAGDNWEAIELYPSEERLIDSVNQFHLWCSPPEAGHIPIGWYTRFVVEENSTTYGSQRKWEVSHRPSDLKNEEEVMSMMNQIIDSHEKEEQ